MNDLLTRPVIDIRPPVTLSNGMTAVLEKVRLLPGTAKEQDVATIVVTDNSPYLDGVFPSAFQLSRQMGGKHVRGPRIRGATATSKRSAVYAA